MDLNLRIGSITDAPFSLRYPGLQRESITKYLDHIEIVSSPRCRKIQSVLQNFCWTRTRTSFRRTRKISGIILPAIRSNIGNFQNHCSSSHYVNSVFSAHFCHFLQSRASISSSRLFYRKNICTPMIGVSLNREHASKNMPNDSAMISRCILINWVNRFDSVLPCSSSHAFTPP